MLFTSSATPSNFINFFLCSDITPECLVTFVDRVFLALPMCFCCKLLLYRSKYKYLIFFLNLEQLRKTVYFVQG